MYAVRTYYDLATIYFLHRSPPFSKPYDASSNNIVCSCQFTGPACLLCLTVSSFVCLSLKPVCLPAT